MQIAYRVGVYVLAALSGILISVYTADLLYFSRIPAVSPFVFGLIFIFIMLDATLVICKGKSPQLITNMGHWSINEVKDKYDIPWQVETKDKKMKDVPLLDISLFFCGGINYWEFSTSSTAESPVVIAPSIFFHKEGQSHCCYANLEKYDFEELPLYIQFVFKQSFSNRVKEKTPIYYSEVSHMNGSATPENMQSLVINRQQNKHDSQLREQLIELGDELKRKDQRKNKVFMKKEIEEVTDEN